MNGIDNSILDHIQVEPLPLPDKDAFEKPRLMPEKEFHRVSVAYGLTVAHEFAGIPTNPKNINRRDDLNDNVSSHFTERFVGKEVT